MAFFPAGFLFRSSDPVPAMFETLHHCDCLDWMKAQPDNSVDLVIGSPPYEAARTYGIEFKLRGQDWADWMFVRMREMVRISRGLVCMVVEGQTRNYRYSAAPILLMADLHRAGIVLRKPPIFSRVGIPGSGGPDWLRNDYEFIVCCTKGGKLPWSDNTAMGHPPKWAPGGAMSNRTADGRRKNARDKDETRAARVNQWGKNGHAALGGVGKTANGDRDNTPRPSHRFVTTIPREGMHNQETPYSEPVLANPGNIIKCIVGGGVMGSRLAHENEAPFPEALAEFFIRSFCSPGGIVLDPFSGSGTVVCVARKFGRSAIGLDVRESQIDLAGRRLAELNETLQGNAVAS